MSSYKELIEELQTLGLSHREATVYLSCLQHPKTTPSQLATITKIKRTSLYPILESLIKKGFAYAKVYNRQQRYFAYPPQRALEAVSSRAAQEAATMEKNAKRLVSKLASISDNLKVNAATGVTHFSGNTGTHELIDKILRENQDIYWLGSSKIFLELNRDQQRDLFQRLSVQRMETNTTAYAITDKKFTSSQYFHGGSVKFRQLRIIELPKNLHSMYMVTGNLCGFIKIEGSGLEATVFYDPEYAALCRFSLQCLWESLPG